MPSRAFKFILFPWLVVSFVDIHRPKEASERFLIILHQICGCYYIQMRFPNFFQCSLVFFEYQLSVARNATQQLFVESALISILYPIVIAEGHPTTECFQILRSASNVFFSILSN